MWLGEVDGLPVAQVHAEGKRRVVEPNHQLTRAERLVGSGLQRLRTEMGEKRS